MNLLSSLLRFTAAQIAALRAKNTSQDTEIDGAKSRITTAEGNISTLTSRIETAISAVTTSTEVTDIRVGDDRVTYSTAGTAVRTQFNQLKSNLHESDNILFNGTYTVGSDQIIRGGVGTHGEPTDSTTVIRAKNLYHIPKGSRFVLTPGTACAKVMAVQYDLNRNFIKNIGSWDTTEITWKSDIDSLYVFMFRSASGELLPSSYDGTIRIFTKEYELINKLLDTYNAKKRQNAVAYVSNDNVDWTLSGNAGSTCALTLGDNIPIRTNTGLSDPTITIQKADILSKASAYSGVSVSDNTITGSAFCIYYDFDSSSVKVSGSTDANCYKNTCILFLHHWGSVTTGEIVRSVLSRKVKTNETNLVTLDSRVSALEGSDVPAYLQGEVSNAVSSLVETCDEKSLVAVFTTDNHYGASNGMNFPQTAATIKAINEKYPIDVIIDGGDAINGDESKATDVSRIQEIVGSLKAINGEAYTIVGNHDDGSFTAQETPLLSAEELYSLFGRHMTKAVDNIGETKSYGYKDFESVGIRLIILDSHIYNGSNGATPSTWGYDSDQVAWLTNEALNTTNQVMIFSHMGVTQEFSVANIQPVNGVAVRTAIESFIANGGVVIGFFHGHTHWDYMGKHSQNNGFYEISTGCSRIVTGPITLYSGYYPTGATMPIREAETSTQELYDIIVVKPNSRTVNMIRFGAGDNRAFSY